MSKPKSGAEPRPAWLPADYSPDVTSAIKALEAGVASSGQQQTALRWIIEAVAGAYDMSFRPGSDGARETDFAEGRRFVGNQIIKQLKLRQTTPK